MYNNNNNNNVHFTPVIVYNNVDTDKSKILFDNKGKSGIYLWTHKETGKIYVGSAVDLSNRLSKYFSPLDLKRIDNYISRALLHHTYSTFTLSILEYIDISNLSKEETKKLILEREQFYIDSLEPGYNILKVAGSSLGFIHSEGSKTLMSIAQKSIDRTGQNNPMFGRVGENNPFYGQTHSPETLKKLIEANLGKVKSKETKEKMSEAKGSIIYVYDTQGILIYTFSSARNAAENLNSHHQTIIRYTKSKKVFRNKWILSTSLITP